MLRLGYAALVLGIVLLPLSARADCQHRRLNKVMHDGQILQLDNGSQWRVSDYDQSEAATWQQDATITACEGELINTERHETAQAREVKRGYVGVPQAD